MKTLLAILFALALALPARAQTPNTNDIRVTWNCPLDLSTNQFSDAQWWYRQNTNGQANPPLMADWVRNNARIAVAGQIAEMRDKRLLAEQSRADFDRLRQWWIEATPAQRTNLVNSLP